MIQPPHLTKIIPGDVLMADGTWPLDDPHEKGTRGQVMLEGSTMIWVPYASAQNPCPMTSPLQTDDLGFVRGLTRTALELA